MSLRAGLALLAALAVHAPADAQITAAEVAQKSYFPADAQADFTLETAIADARETGRIAVVVLGADWCHDSRALAEVLTSAAFTERFGSRFAVTFIDVGKPQIGQGRNLDIARGFGVANLASTPALFVVAGDGSVLNGTRYAIGWRNAASRRPERIMDWFARFQRRLDHRR